MKCRGDDGPCLVEALALVPSARREDRLRAGHTPAHAALLETLGDERFARGFDDTGADHEAPRLEVGVVHSLSVFSEVGEFPLHDLLSRMLHGEMLERP